MFLQNVSLFSFWLVHLYQRLSNCTLWHTAVPRGKVTCPSGSDLNSLIRGVNNYCPSHLQFTVSDSCRESAENKKITLSDSTAERHRISERLQREMKKVHSFPVATLAARLFWLYHKWNGLKKQIYLLCLASHQIPQMLLIMLFHSLFTS